MTTRETRRQRFWRSIQGIVAGLSVALVGIVLGLDDITLGPVQIPQSPLFGTLIAIAGLLYAASKVAALHRSRDVARTP